ncbi:GNAT family N-acetyltransferase [Leptolyngbya ohadii]|uniref:GNAT family N-acetyltransferase n=1 Tax=Leptolyngbya ohadii TaxID=1962290 RepID=UPI000B599626|nr:GNAT family protein [Leptolyngbya ohadii]
MGNNLSVFPQTQSILTTPRLTLRSLSENDAPAIQEALSDRAIADTMISFPFPYPPGAAADYIRRQQTAFEQGEAVTFGIELGNEQAEQKQIIGAIEIREIDREHLQAELSFWLAKNFWKQGYMSETLPPILQYAFLDLGLNRLYAYYMTRNPACGRLLRDYGFVQEGVLRQRVRKWGEFEDVVLMSILREEW